jgi:tripartite-type tricarboxylate transporter receptor subunit TctC
MPNLPTLNRFVAGYEANSWQGVGAPRGTPAEIISKLNAAINAALADVTMKSRLSALGGTVMPWPPFSFGALLAKETKKWAKVVAFSGARAD